MQGDVKALAQISGVGKKTAERVVVELRDKLGALPGPVAPAAGAVPVAAESSAANDAVLALTALGFTRNDAVEAVRAAQAVLGPDAPVDKLVRACLRKGA
jgi:Holliday junction DNA helicase RuvA